MRREALPLKTDVQTTTTGKESFSLMCLAFLVVILRLCKHSVFSPLRSFRIPCRLGMGAWTRIWLLLLCVLARKFSREITGWSTSFEFPSVLWGVEFQPIRKEVANFIDFVLALLPILGRLACVRSEQYEGLLRWIIGSRLMKIYR